MNRRKILKSLPLILVAYLVLAFGLHFVGHRYFTVLLQAVKLEITAFSDSYEPQELSAQWQYERHVVYSKVTRTKAVTDNKGRVYPWLQFENRVTIDGFYVYHLLIITLVLAWPYGSLRRRITGILLGLGMAIAATLIETPFLLIGEWDIRFSLSTWAAIIREPYEHYMHALGGRQMLSLLLAGAAIAFACRLFPLDKS